MKSTTSKITLPAETSAKASKSHQKAASVRSTRVKAARPATPEPSVRPETDELVEESRIPLRAVAALGAAARKARKLGLDRMEITNDRLELVTQDGTRTFIKHLEPKTRVEVGTKIRLR